MAEIMAMIQAKKGVVIPLTNLLMWFKKNTGITKDEAGYWSKWANQAASGSTYDAIQLTGANQGLSVHTLFNDYISLDGDDFMNFTQFTKSSISIFIACRLIGPQGGDYIIGNNTSNSRLGYYANYGYAFETSNGLVFNTTHYDQIKAAEFHVASFIYNGTTVKYYIDGILIGSDSITGTVTFNKLFSDASAQRLKGFVSEVIVYEGAVNSKDQEIIENYLSTVIHGYYNKVPIMTGETTPSGIVTKSHQYDAVTYPAWKVFDDNGNTSWYINNAVFPEWVAYQFTTPKKICQYRITAAIYNDRYPTAWKIQGSNDGSSWTDLDIQTGQTFTNAQKKEYEFLNTTDFTHYRFLITAGQSSTELLLGRIELSE